MIKNEFNRVFDPKDLPKELVLQATTKECIALAKRFSFTALHDLQAVLAIEKIAQKGFVINGMIKATVDNEAYNIPIKVILSYKDIESEEDIEIIVDDKVDIGEIIAQYLSLGTTDFLSNTTTPLSGTP